MLGRVAQGGLSLSAGDSQVLVKSALREEGLDGGGAVVGVSTFSNAQVQESPDSSQRRSP